MKNESFVRTGRVPLLAIALVGLMGATVLIGWRTGLQKLVQINPAFAPMQFNTAVSFLFLALAMGGAVLRKPVIAKTLGVAVAVIGILTLTQYMSGRNFGIDELLQDGYITVQTSYPGRMAPATAFAFVLSGLAAFILGGRSSDRSVQVITEVMAALIVGLSLVAVIGYVTGVEQAHGWGTATHMAVHTAFGFLLIGIVTLHIALRTGVSSTGPGIAQRISVPVAIVALTTSLSLWQALDANVERRILDTTESSRRALEDVFELHVGGLLRSVERMAARWKQDDRTSKSKWEADAREYVNDEFLRIGWLGRDSNLRWMMQSSAGLATGERDASSWQLVRELCATEVTHGLPAVAALAQTHQHRAGLLIAVPLVVHGLRDGCLIAHSDLRFLQATPALDRERFAYNIRDASGEALWAESGESLDDRRVRSSTIDVYGRKWVVSAWPTETGLSDLQSPLPLLVLLFGVSATILTLASLGLVQVASRRAAELAVQRDQLHEAQAELKNLAHFDAMTGIGNRNLFLKSLESTLLSAENSGQPVALLVMDLNGFKDVNDQLGHKAGDVVLTVVADRIQTLLNGIGQVYRIGGDEFAVVLDAGSDQAAGINVACRIAERVSEPIDLYGESRKIGVSIGIAGFPRHGRNVDAMIRKADVAMFEAKMLGRPVVADLDMGATTVLRLRQDARIGAKKGSP